MKFSLILPDSRLSRPDITIFHSSVSIDDPGCSILCRYPGRVAGYYLHARLDPFVSFMNLDG
jgi:hypothetical protein